ncbi:hypothetical protein D3C76_26210 [compost metagenome]
MFSDIHIGHLREEAPDDIRRRLRALDEYGPDPVCYDQFHSSHPNDQGERTNKKLKVQPFYQRGRDGKMRKY